MASLGLDGTAAVFERAMAAMHSEWRRVEHERAEWDVERIRLKAKLTAADKRIAQLTSLCRLSQRHIAVLERLLGDKARHRATPSECTGDAVTAGGLAAGELAAATQSTRQRSRELLRRCLSEIEILLAGSSGPLFVHRPPALPAPPAPPVSVAAESPRLSPAKASSLSPEVTLLRRNSALPNGAGGSSVFEADFGSIPQSLNSLGSLRMDSGDILLPAAEPPPPGLLADYDDQNANLEPPFRGELSSSEEAETDELVAETLPRPPVLPAAASDPEPRPIRKIAERRRRSSQPPPASALAAAAATEAAPSSDRASGSLSDTEQTARPTARPGAADDSGADGWRPKKTLIGHLDAVRALGLRAGDGHGGGAGPQVLSGSDDGMVVLWDLERSERRRSRRQRTASDVVPAAMYRGHLAAVTSVAWAEERHEFAYSGSLDSSIKVWALPPRSPRSPSRASPSEPEACFPLRELSGHSDAVWDLALAPGAGLLASVAADASCRLWSTEARHSSEPERARFVRQSSAALSSAKPTSTCFVGGGDSSSLAALQLAVAFVDGTIDIYDVAAQARVLTIGDRLQPSTGSSFGLGAAMSRITRVASRQHGPSAVIAAACAGGSVHLFDARSGDGIAVVQAYAQPPGAAAVAATAVDLDLESHVVVTGGSDGVVKWWDWRMMPRASVHEATAHATKAGEGVCVVRMMAPNVVVSGGGDGLARVFAKNGQKE
ncbi:1,2-dihydroxy-3-keto-5-methylthiopentene dioxygenase [Coemansia thaxteri]|nr:1,2-dihydroxy-3-keto-5-methylthiopentene dioxygenase [Coemansia thaxteri]KAJ2474461.1 1,2-dihydroxy-3-keto-5-methylthiopentene dioxygenase [Coemansia sp. RSA 2322]